MKIYTVYVIYRLIRPRKEIFTKNSHSLAPHSCIYHHDVHVLGR